MAQVVKLSDIKDAPICQEGNERRYNCPFCLDIRGKDDTEAKLYYNEKKRLGQCWKCHTIVVGDQDWSLEYASSKLKLSGKEAAELYDLSEWSFPVVDGSPCYDYLVGRGLSKEYIEKYQFRESDSFTGVVIPNPVSTSSDKYLTDFCQIRYLRKDSYLRYLGIPKSRKPVYGVNLIHKGSAIAICEGVFSCIASDIRLGLGSLALYGKSMSVNQEQTIKKLNPISILLILDGKELRDIIEIGRRLSYFVNTKAVFLPFGKDPEEDEDLVSSVKNYSIDINHITLKMLDNVRYTYANPEKKWQVVRDMCLRRNND